MSESIKILSVGAVNLYRTDMVFGRVRITTDNPLVGYLSLDASGLVLVPEEDHRGGSNLSIRVHGVGAKTRFIGLLVQLTGVWDDDTGITVEKIAVKGGKFASAKDLGPI